MTREWLCERVAWIARRLRGSEFYTLDGEDIVRRIGFRHIQRIHSQQIAFWSIEHEMVFDLIHIHLTDESGIIWLDRGNDLIQALSAVAGAKQKINASHR